MDGYEFLDEELLDKLVLKRVQHHAFGRLSVTPCPARFLVVRLDAAGQVVVNDEPEVSLVDPHPKRVGRDDHLDIAGHEAFLNFATLI